ncbi:hypothetical protein LCGC14_0388360 [marine sediment metagenome]|uniref:Uncharacterized protein n=1 Tax=marine sediment metagenome TaxID=412755 RepID=A0A0F9T5W9_9ZZZZ
MMGVRLSQRVGKPDTGSDGNIEIRNPEPEKTLCSPSI